MAADAGVSGGTRHHNGRIPNLDINPIGFLARYGFDRTILRRVTVQSRMEDRDPLSVLISHRVITRRRFYQLLARDLGVPFVDNAEVSPTLPVAPGSAPETLYSIRLSRARLPDGQWRIILAPPVLQLVRLRGWLRDRPVLRGQIAIVHHDRLQDLIRLAAIRTCGIDWPVDLAFLLRLPCPVDRLATILDANRWHVPTIFDRYVTMSGHPETVIYRAVADELELPFAAGPLPPEADEKAIAALSGKQIMGLRHIRAMLPDGESQVVAAPSGADFKRLRALVDAGPQALRRMAVTTPARMRQALRNCVRDRWLAQAQDNLRNRFPDLSAGRPVAKKHRLAMGMTLLAAIIAALAALGPAGAAGTLILTVVFLSNALMRFSAALAVNRHPRSSQATAEDSALPAYSVLVPLYREAESVPDLIRALLKLDYPVDRLDIKLIVEAEDAPTRRAVADVADRPPFDIVVVPPGEPRTKPKALNYALPFATGALVTVFDAEDRPDPMQLRHAVAAFDAGDRRLACVQARLAIDNGCETWFSRQFAFEYAALFGGLLPWLASHGSWFPLGGTSNHFRKDVLEAVGGWDAHNVTEDADLGVRLRRFGWRLGMIDSVTYEEAPIHWRGWLGQRSRWYKGWLQTWLVHMRRPVRLWREMGRSDFLAFQLVIGGSLVALLAHVLFIAYLVTIAAGLATPPTARSFFEDLVLSTFLITGVGGYAAAALLTARTIRRHNKTVSLKHLFWLPIYWLMMSAALIGAIVDLVRFPYRWNKTEHGISKTRPDI